MSRPAEIFFGAFSALLIGAALAALSENGLSVTEIFWVVIAALPLLFLFVAVEVTHLKPPDPQRRPERSPISLEPQPSADRAAADVPAAVTAGPDGAVPSRRFLAALLSRRPHRQPAESGDERKAEPVA
jgi:hypothetical protein